MASAGAESSSSVSAPRAPHECTATAKVVGLEWVTIAIDHPPGKRASRVAMMLTDELKKHTQAGPLCLLAVLDPERRRAAKAAKIIHDREAAEKDYSATQVDDEMLITTDTWFLAVPAEIPASSSGGAQGGANGNSEATVLRALLLSKLEALEAGQKGLKATLDASAVKAERARLAALLVQPKAPSKSSPSRASARAAAEESRLDLKIHVLQYYGLLGNSAGADKNSWTAYTMLPDAVPPAAPALPLAACTLAHIWPAEQEMLASQIAAELALPAGFYAHPRNYLVLPKDAHDGFDNHGLIFLPSLNGSIKVRKWRLEDRSPAEATAILKYHDRELWWPKKDTAQPNLPFMRLLAFRMMSAKQQPPEEDPAVALGVEQEAALTASVTAEGNLALRDLCDRLSLL